MKRLVFFVLVFTVATIAAGFDLDKDMALSKANQNFRALAAVYNFKRKSGKYNEENNKMHCIDICYLIRFY